MAKSKNTLFAGLKHLKAHTTLKKNAKVPFYVLNLSQREDLIKRNEDGSIRINLKPVSVNQCYTGRRFKIKSVREYCKKVQLLLPAFKLPEPPYKIYFKFGLSSLFSDGDNCIKVQQDLISNKYKFNDKLIKRWVVDVENVDEGKEYFEYKIESL